jgi:phosphatidylserine decarboxylase
MTAMTQATYIDRRSGTLDTEPVYGERFMRWAYTTEAGWLITKLFLSRPIVSRIYGWLNRGSWSRGKIYPFVEAMKVDIDDLSRPLSGFKSFNDFFTREIDLRRRPIDPDADICISPVDGRLLAYQTADPMAQFNIKHAPFNLQQLLADAELADRFAGGSIVIARLYLSDYHHFHFPVSGIPGPAQRLGSRCFAITPNTGSKLVPLYARNVRSRTLMETDRFGLLAMIEIGGFTVASLNQVYTASAPTPKGSRKGFFGIGGSTVVLVFEPGAIALDDDLLANTQGSLETYVRFGERIGTALRWRKKLEA